MSTSKCQFLVAAVALATSFSTAAQTQSVELLILPASFVVDGQPFASAREAVAAALAKQPVHISLPNCAAMPTQRILDVMAQLQGKFTGRLSMSVLGEGERGCPGFGKAIAPAG